MPLHKILQQVCLDLLKWRHHPLDAYLGLLYHKPAQKQQPASRGSVASQPASKSTASSLAVRAVPALTTLFRPLLFRLASKAVKIWPANSGFVGLTQSSLA